MTTTMKDTRDPGALMAERREWWLRRRETVKLVCRYLGISQSELAQLTGLSRQTLHGRLAGTTKLEPWEVDGIAVALGIPEWILWSEPADAVKWIIENPEGVRTGSRCFVGIPVGRTYRECFGDTGVPPHKHSLNGAKVSTASLAKAAA